MKRGKSWIFGLFFAGMLLGGCSQDSKLQIVKPRETDEREYVNVENKTVKEQLQVPEDGIHEQYTADNLQVLVSADISIPDVEGIKVKRVTQRSFTDEEFQKIEDAFAPNGTIWIEEDIKDDQITLQNNFAEDETESMEEENRETQTEIVSYEQEELLKLISDKTVQLFQEKDRKRLEEIYWLLEKGEESYLKAGDEVVAGKLANWREIYDEMMLTPEIIDEIRLTGLSEGLESNRQNGQEFVYNTLLGKDDLYEFSFWEEGTDEVYGTTGISVNRYNWYDGGEYPDMGYEETFDQEKLDDLANCDQIMEKLGMEQVERTYSRPISFFYKGETELFYPLRDGIMAVYTRMVDQIPVTVTDQPGTMVYLGGQEISSPYERIVVMCDRGGLQKFLWVNPQTITSEEEENVFLLPFAEIQEIFEDMILTDLKRKGVTGQILIDEICLGYMKVQENISDGKEGLLIPVWDFIGYVSQNVSGLADYVWGERISFMTVNAMDGSIIVRG